jgi:hypothetical protein
MMGSEAQKASVMPTLLEGDEATSLPPILQGRVYADFRDPQRHVRTYTRIADASAATLTRERAGSIRPSKCW